MEKTQITISSRWDKPQIHVKVTNKEISLSMNLNDFVTALIKEIGSVTTVIRQSTFEQRVRDAAVSVIEGVKKEAAKVV